VLLAPHDPVGDEPVQLGPHHDVGQPVSDRGEAGLLVLTAVLAAAALGLGLVALVRVGLTGGSGWRAGLRWAAGQPRAVGLALPILAVPVVLAMTVPVTTLLLPGFLVFALHVMVRRLS
jgi:hypothetical protein